MTDEQEPRGEECIDGVSEIVTSSAIAQVVDPINEDNLTRIRAYIHSRDDYACTYSTDAMR